MSARAHRLSFAMPAAMLAAMFVAPASSAEAPSQRARAFAALPNWTGLWETEAAARLSATGRLEAPKLWGKPPYNAEWEMKTRSAGHNASASAATDLPRAVKVCEPGGFPVGMEHPVPDHLFEVLITPEQTLLVSSDGGIRHIYTDGRQHPAREDLWPTPEGHSIGRWEGDTLVVDTVARKAGPVGPPLPGIANLSEQAHFTERLRLLDADTLQNQMTIEDPQRFAHPWQIVIRYLRARNVDRMIPVNCRENDRNPVIDGHFVIAPPSAGLPGIAPSASSSARAVLPGSRR
jgi:hypothetical protein